MALLLILALAAAAVYLIFFRSDSSQTKRITQKTSITLETTTPGETTAPPSVLYLCLLTRFSWMPSRCCKIRNCPQAVKSRR